MVCSVFVSVLGLIFSVLVLYFFGLICFLRNEDNGCSSAFLSSSLCSGFSSPFYRLPSWLPLTSPAFAGLLSSTNEIVGERRGPLLDRIRCRFSACWIGMEKTNTAVPPATATFQAAMDIFILTPELWKFGNWTSKQLKIPFNFFKIDQLTLKFYNYILKF